LGFTIRRQGKIGFGRNPIGAKGEFVPVVFVIEEG